MKPKNNTEVRKAYLRFAGYLTCCTILAVSIFACFLKTSGIEVKRITEQALEYDHIYAKELSLSNSMDSIYQYMKLMNTSPQINDMLQRLQALQAAAGKPQHLPRGKRLHPSAEYPGRDGEERPDAVHPRQLENKA